RVTVSLLTPTSRAVWRMPQPSARCSRIAVTLSCGSLELNSGVPLNSENRALQALQYNSRWWALPKWPQTERLPAPRWAYRGQSAFWQQKRSRSSVGMRRPDELIRSGESEPGQPAYPSVESSSTTPGHHRGFVEHNIPILDRFEARNRRDK